MTDKDHIEEPKDWITEAIAAVVVAVFVGGATYQWLFDSLAPEMTAVFVLTVMAALATVFGVDRLKAVYSLLK